MGWASTMVLILLLLAPRTQMPGNVVAQGSDAEAAAQVAYELSVLEATSDFNSLYDRIHPDAHAVIPRAAAVGWFQTDYAPLGPGVSTITGVRFVEWTWEVTGQTYPYTAEVSFDQPFADGTVLSDVVRLVQDQNGEWRWFFGRNRAFVEEQIARFVQPVSQPTGAQNMIAVAADDLDAFWGMSFGAAGQRYQSPSITTFNGTVSTSCGPISETNGPGAYCPRDMTIYVAPQYFQYFEATIGDFAWVTVLAHEWGHHVQTLEGLRSGNGSSYELQADCLAGSYARDAETRGLLDPGDVSEAVTISSISGDPMGFPQDAPGAHGSGDQRIASFMRGYLDGFIGCSFFSGQESPASVGTTDRAPERTRLVALLPRSEDVPGDLAQVGDLERTLDEVVANYSDPGLARMVFVALGWSGNVARTYEGDGSVSGVTYVYVSIHEFESPGKAQFALAYSYGDQKRSTGASVIDDPHMGGMSRAMAAGDDVTFLVQEGNLLIRLTVTAPGEDGETIAHDLMEGILGRAG